MRALFLDRDGVVNVQIVGGYVMEFSQFVFHDGVFDALKILHERFDKVLLVTNQQCVGKRLCTMSQVEVVHTRMQEELSLHSCPFDAIYCCPHLAGDHCYCRKPNPGMIQQAAFDFPELNLAASVMAGDALTDMQLAVNAGVRPVHVGAVRHPEFESIRQITPLHFDRLLDFARYVQDNDF